MPCDSRWKPIPTLWLLGCQLICVFIVLGISAYDISYVRGTLVTRPSKRLVLNVICSTFSALAILLHVQLYIKSRLNPLFSIALNTALWFFWISACFYQSIAISSLKGIFDVMCPKHFKDKWLYCQNPRFTFTFSVLTTAIYSVFIIYACIVSRKASQFQKSWRRLSIPFQRYSENNASLEDLLPTVDENGGTSSTHLGSLRS